MGDSATPESGIHYDVRLAHLEPIKYVVPGIMFGVPLLILFVIGIRALWRTHTENTEYDKQLAKMLAHKRKMKKMSKSTEKRDNNHQYSRFDSNREI